ncbi:DnaJ-domain-containing protein [Plenodomus tracheiphilus IPT5]|uniref:DnaJ-domain-containing protein n=1 Tax=Plenodomus tracheiphilus IPT5 TaxID=1408161 RepID=A0A6A7B185_9PLEO|nr:DnaJ-domain-containing protein [Plenodomus tracheiphilus IPT5]
MWHTEKMQNQPPASHYETLQVPLDASQDMIKKAWRGLSLKYHPDKLVHATPQQQAEGDDKMKRINQAHDVLGNPESRATYNRTLPRDKPSSTQPRPPPSKAPTKPTWATKAAQDVKAAEARRAAFRKRVYAKAAHANAANSEATRKAQKMQQQAARARAAMNALNASKEQMMWGSGKETNSRPYPTPYHPPGMCHFADSSVEDESTMGSREGTKSNDDTVNDSNESLGARPSPQSYTWTQSPSRTNTPLPRVPATDAPKLRRQVPDPSRFTTATVNEDSSPVSRSFSPNIQTPHHNTENRTFHPSNRSSQPPDENTPQSPTRTPTTTEDLDREILPLKRANRGNSGMNSAPVSCLGCSRSVLEVGVDRNGKRARGDGEEDGTAEEKYKRRR